jgi:LacI family transcriptional regulator
MTNRKAPRRATIIQVAELAGVSIKTVSRVSNNEPNVRGPVRQRVLDAIQTLGYHPMQSARGLAARHSRLLGLVYDNPSPSYLIRVQHAARQCCEEYGMRLLLHPCDHTSPTLAEELVRLSSHLRLEGLVLVPPVSHDNAVIEALVAARVEIALLAPARAPRGICAVQIDDEHAAEVLTGHLVELGHRHIGFVRGHPDHEATRARLAGHRRAMRRAGLPLPDTLVVDGDFSFESGRRAGALLLDRHARLTAIVASNDDMAAGVIAAAHDRSLAVPAALAVCGFDDTPLASMTWPPLTTMHEPIIELAEAATRMLIRRIRGERAAPVAPDLHCRLIVRESSAAASPAQGRR